MSCAIQHKPSPAGTAALSSSARVQGHVEAAKQNIQDAANDVEAAGKDASALRGMLDTLDRKEVLTKRWLELQP